MAKRSLVKLIFTTHPAIKNLDLMKRRKIEDLSGVADISSNFEIVGEVLMLIAGIPVFLLMYALTSIVIAFGASVAAAAAVSLPLFLYSELKQNKLLLHWMKEHSVGEQLSVCLGCEYNLKGNTSDECPECGEPIVLVRDGVCFPSGPSVE